MLDAMATIPCDISLSQRTQWAEGQPISELMSRALAHPHLISLAAGFVDQKTLPVEPVSSALEALFSDASAAREALQYGTTPGDATLRQLILDMFVKPDLESTAMSVGIEHIVVTAGSNQLLHLVAETLLNPGDIVLCAAPTYLVFVGTLSNVGARAVGVAVDEEGMIPEALERTLARLRDSNELGRVKAVYFVPYFDNPRGMCMSIERQEAIVAIARHWSQWQKVHVIADEAYRQLRYEGDDVASSLVLDDRRDTVIVAGTFSKSFSPGIRIGWGVLPPHLVGPLCNHKGNIDFGSPHFSQRLMAKVLEMDLFESHVERIRNSYHEKLTATLAALDEYMRPIEGVRWRVPTGGLYVWLELPEDIDTGPKGTLFDVALEHGMFYVPGQYCYPLEGESVQKNTIRLSFGVQTPDHVRAGVKMLADAIRDVMNA
jgi:2-aminoadipate transaminase